MKGELFWKQKYQNWQPEYDRLMATPPGLLPGHSGALELAAKWANKPFLLSQFKLRFCYLQLKGLDIEELRVWFLDWRWLAVRALGILAQMVKNPPVMQETLVQSLGQEVPWEKGMATHSSVLAWKIPWTEEPGGLQPMGSQRVRHNWVTNPFIFSICLQLQVNDLGKLPITKCRIPIAVWIQ